MIGIYKITNNVNGKVYIGQSVNIQTRWNQHKNSNKNYPLYNDFKQYGIQNFSFEVIQQCKREELNKLEEYWINFYQSTDSSKGYNSTMPGSIYGHGVVLNNDNIKDLYNDLLNTNISKEELAEKYCCEERTIRDVNSGRTWHDDNLNYPLRKYFVGEDGKKYLCKAENYVPNQLICPLCGKPKTKYAKYCVECGHISEQRCERPNKIQLVKEIVELGFSGTAKKYGVSDKAIVKWCANYGLPTHKKDIVEYSKQL